MPAWKKILIALPLLIAVVAAALLYIGILRQKSETGEITKRLALSPGPQRGRVVDFSSLKGLPKPVQRYFRAVLRDGQPFIETARFTQTGEIRINSKTEKWSAFKARQVVAAQGPGFLWDARISMAPLMHVRVRDAYLDGTGSGKVFLLSALSVAEEHNKPELNSGALYRFLAEAVWYPTALLPGSGVKWRAVDSRRAIATLTDRGISVSLEFRFSDSGEVSGIYTEDRYGLFDGSYIKYPWEGHFRKYETRGSVRIPMEAEVGWHLPGGWWLFWKGRIRSMNFKPGEI